MTIGFSALRGGGAAEVSVAFVSIIAARPALSTPAMASAKSRAVNGSRSSMLSPTPMKCTGRANLSAIATRYAAARGAVELGHHEAGDACGPAENLDLAQRILPDGRVEHQQHRVRRL